MNPTIILGVVILWGASVVGTYFYGRSDGKDLEAGSNAKIELAIAATLEQAQLGAANEIAKIKVSNTTIRSKTETIIRDNPVYAECKHDASGVQLINEALTGRAIPAPGGKLPGAKPPD